MTALAIATPVYRSHRGGWTDEPDGLDLAYQDVRESIAAAGDEKDWPRVNDGERALPVLDALAREDHLAYLGDRTAGALRDELDVVDPPQLVCGHHCQTLGRFCESRPDPGRPGCRTWTQVGIAWTGRCLICDPRPAMPAAAANLGIPHIVGPGSEVA